MAKKANHQTLHKRKIATRFKLNCFDVFIKYLVAVSVGFYPIALINVCY